MEQFGAFAKLQKAKSLGLVLLLNYKGQKESSWCFRIIPRLFRMCKRHQWLVQICNLHLLVADPAPSDMQKMAAAGADLQSAPFNFGSVILFNASANYTHFPPKRTDVVSLSEY